MLDLLTRHPASVGESYFQHAKFAFYCGLKLLLLGFLAIVHGLFPFLFENTASSGVIQLSDCFTKRKNQDK